MQKIIQIYPCLLKLLRKQESVKDGQTDRQTDRQTDGQDGSYNYIPSPLSRGDKKPTNVHFNTYTSEESHILEVKCHIEQ